MSQDVYVEYLDSDGTWKPLQRSWPQSNNEYDEHRILGTLNGVPVRVEGPRSIFSLNIYHPEDN